MKLLIFLIIGSASFISVIILSYLRKDYVKQKNTINAQEYRINNGIFSLDQEIYSRNFIKNKNWLKQKNKGPNPELYKKEIKYIYHLNNFDKLILDKRK